MFKKFTGFSLVEQMHKLRQGNRLNPSILKKKSLGLIFVAIIVAVLWFLPTESFGIDGLTAVQQRIIAIFVYATLMWVLEMVPAWATSVSIMVLLLLLSFDGSNTGGLIAHLGGALMGLAWALSIRRGHDLTAWLNKTIDTIVSWFKGRKRPGVKHEYKENVDSKSDDSNSREARLDEILKKIKQSGYGALTDEEKEILFSFSRKK